MKDIKTNNKEMSDSVHADTIINIDFIEKNIEILDDKLAKIRRSL
jgi:hypothetical protein